MLTAFAPSSGFQPVRTRPVRFDWAKLRPWLLGALLFGGVAQLPFQPARNHAGGCPAYTQVSGGPALIAHAAGGLPARTYANSIEALNLSYGHGLRMFEMDFHELPFGIVRAGHDDLDMIDPRGAMLSDVMAWLRAHPDAKLITDFKTDNVSGLKRVMDMAPDLRGQIYPFIYGAKEFAPVVAMGFEHPIFATYGTHDRDWLDFVNSHPVYAVAMTQGYEPLMGRIHRPVILHTIDKPIHPRGANVMAVITNCLVPR
ncbi:hypothetical protein HZF05_08980 [Sphingomonas sp. CGMCC 1.13654]|uniref:Glycerophosphodiester phosphodiesterase n=1 Tax=Sphingomonas chungangi TaxID=2683589 RepID=A0A838L411_9SPHN|nr:hypothetical protein [Sphingomonas chungangi]MBA2934233.1 hypothetical protein [Sphingomonas chungangi]MVW57274.1 hypothetical protein [Sphingomonas chungangi]